MSTMAENRSLRTPNEPHHFIGRLSGQEVLHRLNTFGFVVVNNYWSPQKCAMAREEIDHAMSQYRDKIISKPSEGTSGDERLFGIDRHYELASEFTPDPALTGLLSAFTDTDLEPHFSVAGRLRYDSDTIRNSGGGWHRDRFQRTAKALIYLSDVDESNGPFSMLLGSNQYDLPLRDGTVTRYTDETIESFCDSVKTKPVIMTGQAGTLILADTSYIHRGQNIEGGARYSLTNYYFESSPQNWAITQDKWGSWFI